MKRLFFINLTLILIMTLAVGCETTRNFKRTMTSKLDSITSDVDQDLYAQVPEDKKVGIPEAEFNLELNKNKEILAELKKERGVNELKIKGYDLDMASKARKKAAIALDIKKLEAINKAGLGEKEKNINTLADLKAKILNIDADIIKYQAKQANVNVVINDLNKQIEEQEQKVKGMKRD
jgi:chromosome segregation ATPase